MLSATLMKNCEFAECGSPVRAMATVPRTLLRPLPDSFGMVRVVFFQFEIGRVATGLRHESRNHAVKNSTVVKAGIHQLQEMRDCQWRLSAVEFEDDRAHASSRFRRTDARGTSSAAKCRAARETQAAAGAVVFSWRHDSKIRSQRPCLRANCLTGPGTGIMIPQRSTGVGAWRSLVAHLLWEQRVGSSNLSAPTNRSKLVRLVVNICARSSTG